MVILNTWDAAKISPWHAYEVDRDMYRSYSSAEAKQFPSLLYVENEKRCQLSATYWTTSCRKPQDADVRLTKYPVPKWYARQSKKHLPAVVVRIMSYVDIQHQLTARKTDSRHVCCNSDDDCVIENQMDTRINVQNKHQTILHFRDTEEKDQTQITPYAMRRSNRSNRCGCVRKVRNRRSSGKPCGWINSSRGKITQIEFESKSVSWSEDGNVSRSRLDGQ